MKISLFQLLQLCLCFISIVNAGIHYPAGPLTLQDQRDIAFVQQHYERPKRSGSGDFIYHLKNIIGQGIKNKITHLAKSSAAGVGAFSHSSSGYAHHPHYYGPHTHEEPHHHHVPDYNLWSFKKSVLFTLLQAVKAIKGGVIALKGQLIKGGGHLLTAKGKLIRGGGEALTAIGKNIASSAFMVIPHDDHEEHHHHHHEDDHYPHHHHHNHEEEHLETHHGQQFSGPGHDIVAPQYGPTGYYNGHLNSIYDGKHDGLVILKKIPPAHFENADAQETQQSLQQVPINAPEFKPLSDGLAPRMQNIITSVYQASSHSSSPDPEDTQASEQRLNPVVQNEKRANESPASGGGLLAQYLQMISAGKAASRDTEVKMFVTPAPSPPANSVQLPESLKPQTKPKSSAKVVTQQPLIVALPQNVDLATLLAQMRRPVPQLIAPNPADYYSTVHNIQDVLKYQNAHNQPTDSFLINYPDYMMMDSSEAMTNNNNNNKKDQTRRLHKRPLQLRTINAPPRTNLIDANKKTNLDIVRSIAFELGPNGPVQIS